MMLVAQIMLGMVQPPQVMPSIQQPLSQPQQQPIQQSQLPPGIQSEAQPPSQSASIGQASLCQPQNLSTPPHENQPLATLPTASLPIPGVSLPSQTALQQPSPQLFELLTFKSLGQQGLQTPGMLHQSLQLPLPLPPRPLHLSHFLNKSIHKWVPTFSTHHNHPCLIPFRFHPLFKLVVVLFHRDSHCQGSCHLSNLIRVEMITAAAKGLNLMQIDRGTSWLPGLPDASAGARLPCPPPFIPSHMGSKVPPPNVPPTNVPPSCLPQITPEMEKALIQQVMSLKPDQINLLPPEQRQQVLHALQLLR